VFNVTLTCNNISIISWQTVLLVEETGENHRPAANPNELLVGTNKVCEIIHRNS